MAWNSKRRLCDCGRAAVKNHAGEMICARCFDCERRGCVGGPSVKRDPRYKKKKA